jgi:hypothetical protein
MLELFLCCSSPCSPQALQYDAIDALTIAQF